MALDAFGEFEAQSAIEQASSVFAPNLTTRWGLAGDAALAMRLKGAQLSLKYRRVDPFFQSLGINYLQRDLQDWTANLDFSLLQKRLRMQVSGGIQDNNLAGFKATGARRLISSVNAQYRPDKTFLLALRYSNYQRETTAGLLELNDTLRQVNVARNAGLTTSYTLRKGGNTIVLTLNAGYQEVEDISDLTGLKSSIRSWNLGFGPSIRFSNGLRLRPSLRYNRNQSADFEQDRLTGGLQLSRQLLDKKLMISLNANYGFTNRAGASTGSVLQSRLNVRYRLRPNMTAYLRGGIAQRQYADGDSRTQTRLSGGYQVAF